MIRLSRSLAAWRTPDFKVVVKDEIERLDASVLPLEQALSRSSHVSAARVGATLLRVDETPDWLCVKAGLFFTGIIAGCSCADDPSPVDDLTEYCEAWFKIDKATGYAEVTVAPEA